MKGCPRCKTQGVRPEDNFCWNDGTKLEMLDDIRCSCGNHFSTVDKFCTNCGLSKEVTLKKMEDEKKKKEEMLKLAQERKI